jgi:hypothetical protein
MRLTGHEIRENPDGCEQPFSPSDDDFADHLKRLRQSLVGKQLRLSCAVGCTEAAVSNWECGKRVPQKHMLPRILETLALHGASPRDLADLLARWESARERGMGRAASGGSR